MPDNDPDSDNERRWLFVVTTDERPGVAASVTAAFSGRGITIESFLGYGADQPGGRLPESVILITFRAFERRMRMVRRAVGRIEVVKDVLVYDCDREPGLVKSAVARVAGLAEAPEELLSDAPVGVQRIEGDAGSGDGVLVISGAPNEVDAAVKLLEGAGRVLSCMYSITPPPEA